MARDSPAQPKPPDGFDTYLLGLMYRGTREVPAGETAENGPMDLASPKGQPAVSPGFCRRWVRAV